jgi:hypothetical protein
MQHLLSDIKMMKVGKIPLVILTLCSIFSCNENRKRKFVAKSIVTEWVGKEILFPAASPCYSMGISTDTFKCTKLLESEYKALLYVDSMGCTSCKLRLLDWQQLIQEADSAFADKLSFLFFFYPKNKKELRTLLSSNRMEYPVFIDESNEINRLNSFPTNTSYQCFLLDKDNRVLLVGNPTLSPKIWELYKEVITGKKAAPPEKQTTAEVEKTEHAFGEVKIGESCYAVFRLKNTGEHPLIISRVATSCGCASAEWGRQPVVAGQIAEVKVEMKPEEAGFFSKTAEVHCNAAGSPITLTVSGTASNQ